ncbi:MAG: ectonucleotide pyrophosphatase/phosphodiesterase [Asticcacaulis sp.]|uniref:alkaline phosphatase family protein n=1 Tax=Asticcacaulis sp. TaxID=1872648 RepID=UPI0039E38A51
MFRKIPLVVAALACLSIASCSHVPTAAPVAETALPGPKLILISIDGFRADYLKEGITPNLQALADGGASAAMRPSFPSLTFPNHYALVTGLRPDHHGIVNNTMRDPQKPGVTFKLSNKEAVADEFWWDDGKPLWETAQAQGVKVATMFWPGSDAAIHGVRPTYWLPYNEQLSSADRVKQVLDWVDLPAGDRPGAITLYYSDVDHQGHDFGPGSPEVDAALRDVDASIGQLVDGLKARGLFGKVNLVIVADHGMAKHNPERFIRLADILPADSYDLVTGGQVAGLNPKPGYEVEVDKALIETKHDYMQCWHKAKIPARFHYGHHRRVPEITCLAAVGGYIVSPSSDNWMPKPQGGSHGYDPAAPEMQALFIANGPAIRRGVKLAPFDNVDVYSLETKLLGIKGEPNDGKLGPLKPALY